MTRPRIPRYEQDRFAHPDHFTADDAAPVSGVYGVDCAPHERGVEVEETMTVSESLAAFDALLDGYEKEGE